MKRILTITLSIMILLSATACGSKAEIERLKKENEELKQQLASYVTNTSSDDEASANQVNVPHDATISFGYIDTSEFPNCLTDGIYRCGSDFDAGDYYILSLYSDNANYDVSNTPDNFSSSRRIIRKIHVENGQYVKLTSALLIPSEQFDTSDWKKYGAFTVGKDLPAGDYKIVPISHKYSSKYASVSGNLAAYQITSQNPLSDVIDCDFLHEKQTYITLTEGQCLMINNAYLTLVSD